MRKIWASRKDKDKRRSWTGSAQSGSSNAPNLAPHSPNPAGPYPAHLGHASSSSIHSTSGDIREEEEEFDLAASLFQHPAGQYAHNGRSMSVSSASYTPNATPSLQSSITMATISSNNPPTSLPSLIRHEYDHKQVKSAWLNVIINSHSNEVNEQALRLFRAELKGSHLFLYKLLPPLTQIKRFKLPSEEEFQKDLELSISSISGATAGSASTVAAAHGYSHGPPHGIVVPPPGIIISNNNAPLPPTPQTLQTPFLAPTFGQFGPGSFQPGSSAASINGRDDTSLYTHGNANYSNNTLMDGASQFEKDDKELMDSESLEEDYAITHWSTVSPHPELAYDYENHILLSPSSVEALVHFLFFSTEAASQTVGQLVQVIPLFPHPNKVLRLINTFLEGLIQGKFTSPALAPATQSPIIPQNAVIPSPATPSSSATTETSDTTPKVYFALNKPLAVERVMAVLKNIHHNFGGFLLNSEVGPAILMVLENLREMKENIISPVAVATATPATPPTDEVTDPTSNKDGEGALAVDSSGTTTETTEKTIKVNDDKLESDFTRLKTSMLGHQQTLINLISHDHLSNLNPLSFISSFNLLNTINLIEFANTICSIDLQFFQKWNSNFDKSLLLYNANNLDYFTKKNPLIFNNDEHIHYLSRLLINHLFLENYTAMTASAILERKARIIEKWIDLGCLLDKLGNMSSWLGIALIILSQPFLRLTRIWLLVSSDYIKLLKNDWSPVLFELDRRYLTNGVKGLANNFSTSGSSGAVPSGGSPSVSVTGTGSINDEGLKDSFHIMAPRGLGKIYYKENVIPYFGDLIITNSNSPPNVHELEIVWKKINYSFNRWNEYLGNLNNYSEIIHYNNDVLRRYDSMGFIFSNESLNQVLYLGVNDDNKSHPPPMLDDDSSTTSAKDFTVDNELKLNLLKLIEINCKSVNITKIMAMSLGLEQNLPEGYNYIWQQHHLLNKKYLQNNGSNLSISSADSLPLTIHGGSGSNGWSTFKPENSFNKIPLFNNDNFMIKLSKYDELTLLENGNHSNPQCHSQHGGFDTSSIITIDDELVFRVDDFINDMEVSSSNFDEIDNVDIEDDVPGLGIDVDDILNSDKFNNVLIDLPNLKSLQLTQFQHQRKSVNTNRGESILSGLVSTVSAGSAYMKYLPKFATIDRLVDLLLIDSKYFNESLTMDLNEYRFIFLLNYDSFISTKEFLDKLAHRFINSGNAVISIMKKNYYQKNNKPFNMTEFINWDIDETIDLTELGEVDYELLIKIQINILKVLIVLLNNFYANFAIDLDNKSTMIKLLKLYLNEILQWYNSNKINNNLELSFESLVNYYKRLKKLFIKKSYRPIELSKFDEYLINEFRFNNSLHEVPINRNLPGHKNLNKIEKFLHKFNKLLMIFYKGIRAEDWMKVFKVLEYQFESGGLMEFQLQKNSMNEDNLIILNIFTFMESLNDGSKDRLIILKKFPLIFRKLFKLYYKFKVYLLIQLADLNITVEERLDRMKTLLIMVHLSKLKMRDHQFVWEGVNSTDGIPSCIESAIINVIYSPESRSFSTLWIKASHSLKAAGLNNGSPTEVDLSYESINSLLPTNTIFSADLIINHEPLLPCFGWIIENFIEINKIPNFHKTTDIINFNKKYLVYKIIKEFGIEDFDDGNGNAGEISPHDTREFEFLLKLDESLVRRQNIREYNMGEKDRVKLFKSVLKEQHRILIADNKKKVLRDQQRVGITTGVGGAPGNSHGVQHVSGSQGSINSIGSGTTVGNNSTSGASGQLNKKSSSSSLRRQSLNHNSNKSSNSSRFKISGLFNKSRPFSLNVSGLTSLTPDKCVHVKELPSPDTQHEPKQKPFLIIPMKNKKVFPVYLLPLCFKIDSENSNEDYLFQTVNEFDLNDWLIKLNYANRHWFHSKNLNLKVNNNNLTFGVPITLICNREKSFSPSILSILFEEIEAEGIKDVGIYRISTSISELNQVKQIIDKTGTISFVGRTWDVHTLTSVVKSYFRELPDALLTDKVIEQFFDIKQGIDEGSITVESEIENYKETVNSLPTFNYYTLKLLIRHLQNISRFSEKNRMNTSNLATVIGPALTEASSLEQLVNNFGFMNSILEKLIVNFAYIFDEPFENENAPLEVEDPLAQPKKTVDIEEIKTGPAEEVEAIQEVEATKVEGGENTVVEEVAQIQDDEEVDVGEAVAIKVEEGVKKRQ